MCSFLLFSWEGLEESENPVAPSWLKSCPFNSTFHSCCCMRMWSFSSTIFDTKTYFSRRWHKLDGLPFSTPPPTPRNMVVVSKENLSLGRYPLQKRRINGRLRVGVDFWVARGEKSCPLKKLNCENLREGNAASVRELKTAVSGHCLWILGVLTVKPLTNREFCGYLHVCVCFTSECYSVSVLTSKFLPPHPLKWQNCVILSLPPPLAFPPHKFENNQNKTKPWKQQAL